MTLEDAQVIIPKLRGLAAMRGMRWTSDVEIVFAEALTGHSRACADDYVTWLAAQTAHRPDVGSLASVCKCSRTKSKKADLSGVAEWPTYAEAMTAFKEGFMADREARDLPVPPEWAATFKRHAVKIEEGRVRDGEQFSPFGQGSPIGQEGPLRDEEPSTEAQRTISIDDWPEDFDPFA